MVTTVSKALMDLQARLRADIDGTLEGDGLSPFEVALVDLGVRASVTSLDAEYVAAAIDRAIASGASPVQIQEVVTLVSGLGVHSLMVTAPIILASARAAELIEDGPLDDQQIELWDRYVVGSSYWQRFEQAAPGFLEALLRLSPATFQGFFDYCSLPAKSRILPVHLAELIALATDVTPSHVFPMGAMLHQANAVRLGVGRLALEQTLEIAADCPIPNVD